MSKNLCGFHNVITQVQTEPSSIEVIYINQNRQDKRQQELVALANKAQIKIEFVNNNQLDKLANGGKHQGVVASVTRSYAPLPVITLNQLLDDLKNQQHAVILVLDGITDPHNLGAIIRTAECFGVCGIILPKDNSARSDNDIVIKTSSGAVNYVPVITVNNLSTALDTLKKYEFWVAGAVLSDTSQNLFDFKPPQKIAWVMGSEGTGIRRLVQENCDYHITIPMRGHTQSLNVSVATGVVLSYTAYLM